MFPPNSPWGKGMGGGVYTNEHLGTHCFTFELVAIMLYHFISDPLVNVASSSSNYILRSSTKNDKACQTINNTHCGQATKLDDSKSDVDECKFFLLTITSMNFYHSIKAPVCQ